MNCNDNELQLFMKFQLTICEDTTSELGEKPLEIYKTYVFVFRKSMENVWLQHKYI